MRRERVVMEGKEGWKDVEDGKDGIEDVRVKD